MKLTDRFLAKAVTNFIRLREHEEREDRRGSHAEVPPTNICELAAEFEITAAEALRICRRLASIGLLDMNYMGFIFEPEAPKRAEAPQQQLPAPSENDDSGTH